MRKIYSFLAIVILSSHWVNGQSNLNDRVTKDCECPNIEKNPFDSPKEAKEVVQALSKHVGLRIPNVLEVVCTPNAQALMCTGERYILYNKPFLQLFKDEKSWAQRFIMAHEIGHHLHNHTKKSTILNSTNLPTILLDSLTNKPYVERQISSLFTKQKKVRKVYRPKFVNLVAYHQHFKEFMADATATWILFQEKITLAQLNDVWDTYGQKTKADIYTWTQSHPSIASRKQMTETCWKILQQQAKESKTTSSQSETKLLTQKALQQQALNAPKFASSNNDIQTVVQYRFWEYANSKHSLSIEPFAGFILQNDKFAPTVNTTDEIGAKLVGLNSKAGLRFTRIAWLSPVWFEADVAYKQVQFTTFTNIDNLPVAIERFKWKGIQLNPKIILTTVSGKYNYWFKMRMGGFFSSGLSFDVPLQLSYINYFKGIDNLAVSTQASISPTIEAGLIFSDRNTRALNARIGVFYQPQRFMVENLTKATITVPQLGIHASARLGW